MSTNAGRVIARIVVPIVAAVVQPLQRFLNRVQGQDDDRFQLPPVETMRLLRDLEATPRRPELNDYLAKQVDQRRTLRRHRSWLRLQERLDRCFAEAAEDLRRPVDPSGDDEPLARR